MPAVVGNRNVKRALACALSSPDIRAVLICGPPGTGKTMLANSLDNIVPGKRTVRLPLNADNEGVTGGLDLESVLRDGRRRTFKGVLERSDGNILIAENMSALRESVTNMLLDSVHKGYGLPEGDGMSGPCECKFLLIGTIDSRECLSDGVMDCFDMCVFTETSENEADRAEIVTRHIEYENDPEGLRDRFSDDAARMSETVIAAMKRYPHVTVSDGYVGAISKLSKELNVEGHRGDISMMHVSRALAAMDGRDSVSMEDLKEAASMCLEHRRKDVASDASSEPERGPDKNDSAKKDEHGDNDEGSEREDGHEDVPSFAPDSLESTPDASNDAEEIFVVGREFDVIDYMPKTREKRHMKNSGRLDAKISKDHSGRTVGYRIPSSRTCDIALGATIYAAAPHQTHRDRRGLAIAVKTEDVREKVREKRHGTKIMFLVDGSGSMGAEQRMVAVKGAILSLLREAYLERNEVGLIVFRKNVAEAVLSPTKSVLTASRRLAEMPTGGRTPLVHGMAKAYDMLRIDASKGYAPILVILTDGRNNVKYGSGDENFREEMLSVASSMSSSGIRFVVIDTETGHVRLGLAVALSKALAGTYIRLEELNAEYLKGSVNMIK
jgi:magnesium chelatase subunit D